MSASQTLHIIGAGAFGSALAYTWWRAGRDVRLWCRDQEQAATLSKTGRNPKVPACPPMPGIRAGGLDRFDGRRDGDAVILAVKAQAQRAVYARIEPKLLAPGPVLTLAKGFANPAGELLSQGLQPPGGLGVLSGPSFALDLFHDRPTALTLAVTAAAGTAATPSTPLLEWLSTPSLRLYASQDPVGVQVCGAMKNIIAIACGCAEGMGLGASARTALMTRGLREIERVILAYGGDPKTAAGLAGVGDLALTCQDRQSRNFSFGYALGQGQAAQALLSAGTTVEGAGAAVDLLGASRVSGLDLPIARAVAALVREENTPASLVEQLLSRRLAQDT